MTDQVPAKSGRKANQTSFKPGYDPRRWLSGRGKKSPEQREGEQILLAVLWKELSREFDAATAKPLEPEDTITALELAARNAIKKDFRAVMDRIAGKVTENVNLNQTGITKVVVEYADSTHPTPPPASCADEDKGGAQEV